MRLIPVTPPDDPLLTASEVRSRLGIGSDVADATLDAFVKAAQQGIEGADGWLGRSLVTQSWQLILDAFPCEPLRLPLPPVRSITTVKYYDAAGVLQTLASDQYQLLQGARPAFAIADGGAWPAVSTTKTGPVEIVYLAGYGDPEDVPEPIRAAIALMVSHLRSMSARNLFISEDTVEGVGSKSFVVGGNAGAAIDATVQALLSTYRVY